MKRMAFAVAACLLVGPSAVLAQAKEQLVPVNSYWVGPYVGGAVRQGEGHHAARLLEGKVHTTGGCK